MQKLTEQEKMQIAKEFEVEYRALNAVVLVESSGAGFDAKTGKIKIQFEPYHFQKYTNIRIANGVENQTAEWKAYEAAYKLNADAAMLSTSWGLGQVMGFNFKAAGFKTVKDMVDKFSESEMEQLRGMFNFIKSNNKLITALRVKDWATFARYYNGPKYKDFKYDTRLAEAYNSSKVQA